MESEAIDIPVIESELPDGWERATIRQLLEEGSLDLVQDGNHGGAYPKPDEFETTGVPLITGADVNASSIDLHGCKFLNPRSAEKLRIGFAREGDVLLTHKGTMGKTAIVPLLPWPYVIINPQLTLYRVSKTGRLQNRFLKFFFDGKPFQTFLERISGISTISTLSLTVQKSLEIPVPPIATQRAIAHILGTLDDKIELNRRMNATLESMARALFQSWFVDFDPVRAKMDGRQPAGMAPHTAALFPDSFEESELGLIPKGWQRSYIGEVVAVLDSRRVPLSGKERQLRQGTYPYYGAASIMDYVDSFIFDGVYVLMGEDGSVINNDGTPVLQYAWGRFWVNNHAHVLQGANGVCTEHVYLSLKNSNIASFVTGAVQPKLNQGNMNQIPFMLPPGAICGRFQQVLTPLFEKIRSNANETITLSNTRDTLLPKLLCGELCVKHAEKLVGELT